MPADPELRLSVGLPQLLHQVGPDGLARYAERAEELGFAGLWTLESSLGGGTAHAPVVDGLATLAFAAAVTRRVRLGIAVIVLPRRNPLQLARELASLDVLSGGRLIVGVGVGGADPGLEQLDLPVGRRGRRTAEGVEVLRALWANGDGSYQGELYRFAGVRAEPKPVQRPGPPVWFGGSQPAALRRAARLGDGWIGGGASSTEDFVDTAALMHQALRAARRDPGEFAIAKRAYISVAETEREARIRLAAVLDPMYGAPGMAERCGVCGPPEQCAEEVRRLHAAGAHEVVLTPLQAPLAQLEELARVAELARR